MNNYIFFDTWSIHERELPEPSHIFRISPCELYSPFVESLSSYICRLAEAHKMLPTIFIRRCILKDSSEDTLLYLYRSFNRINGTAEFIDMLRREVENATQLSNLHNMTIFGLRHLFSVEHLMNKYGAWCPLCLNEWREGNQPVYIPLIWHLQTVQCCVKHSVTLQSACPNCNSPQHILHRFSRVGYCERCRNWMGQEIIDVKNTSLDFIGWSKWVVHNLGLLFREIDKGTDFQRHQVVSALEHYKNTLDHDLINELKLAGFNGIQEWIKKGALPTLQNLLAICNILGLTVVDFLNKREVLRDNQNLNEIIYVGRRMHDMEHIKKVLVSAINSNKVLYPTLKDISTKLNCSVKFLTKNFPDLCNEITTKYKNNKSLEKNIIIQRLRNAVHELHRQNDYPSSRKVGEIIGDISFTRKPMLREVWHHALLELGYEIH